MDGYEKRLVAEYFTLWRNCDALECALDNQQKFEEKVGKNQFELLKRQYELMATLKDVLELRIKDLGLDKHFNEFGMGNEDLLGDPYSDQMVERQTVLQKARHDCMAEMYRKSQPSASYDEYLKMYRAGLLRDDDKDRVYNRHYLSEEEFEYILDKYVDAYGMNERWNDYVDTVISYFDADAPNDKWIPERRDEDGFTHPGYRGYEPLPHFAKVVEGIIDKMAVQDKESIENVSMAIYDAVIKRIETCRNFYKFDREESGFHVSIGLGEAPTCNKEIVTEYWKNKGVDITIEDRDPNTLWEKDYYGDDYENDYMDVDCEEFTDDEPQNQEEQTEQC